MKNDSPTDHRVLGVIPARGGSKGVPRKNVRLVAGRPLIHWSILAARESAVLTRCVVSTDDEEIAAVSREAGAEVLMRPPELAADETPMPPVILHALRACDAEAAAPFTHIALLQPTAPMRAAADVDAGVSLLLQARAAASAAAPHNAPDSLTSVYQVEDCHPARMYHMENGLLRSFYTEPPGSLRQGLPPVYHRNGALYVCPRETLEERGALLGERILPYVMPRERSANIDDELDLAVTDFLMTRLAAGRVA